MIHRKKGKNIFPSCMKNKSLLQKGRETISLLAKSAYAIALLSYATIFCYGSIALRHKNGNLHVYVNIKEKQKPHNYLPT